MADGAFRRVIRRLVPRRLRWLAKAAFKRTTGLYYRDIRRQQRDVIGQVQSITDRLDTIQHQVIVVFPAQITSRLDEIQHQATIVLPAQIEAQGEIMDLMLRRLRLSGEEVIAHLGTMEERVAALAEPSRRLEEAQQERGAQLVALQSEVAVLADRLPHRIMTLADNEPFLTDHLLMQGDIFLDVGASIGTYSLNLAAGYRKVFAFEPHPRARRELILALAGLDNVVVNGMALYSHTGIMRLYLYSNDAQASVLPAHEEADAGPAVGEFLVRCMKLDDMEFDGEVDFVKVDCEGAEVEVIAGAVNTIAKHKPQLLVEIHSKKNGPKIRAMLGEFGYRFKRISNPRRTRKDPYWQHHYWLSCLAR